MALIQEVPNTFTDTSLPTTYVEPMLNAGTLWLVDPTHPYGAWPAGTNQSSTTIPNIASENASRLTGGAAADLLFTSLNTLPTTANANGLIERTGKGGLHGIISLSAPNSVYSMLRPSPALRTYLYNNRDHDLYFSLWHRITRAVADSEARSVFALSVQQNNNANYLMSMESALTLPASGSPERLGYSSTNQKAAGNSLRAVGVTAATNSPANLTDTHVFVIGRGLTWAQGTNAGFDTPSHIFYRGYCEDLTVSGRTFAQAYAEDLARYTKEVLTSGGRYYGDTFTDPTTIP